MAGKRKKNAAGLTPMEQRFVEQYPIDLNAFQAALRSGYSKRTSKQIGQRLLGKPHIQNAIAAALRARSERTKVTADLVLTELSLLSKSSVANYDIDDAGNLIVVAGAPPEAIRAISSVKKKRRIIPQPDGRDPIVEVEVEFKLWDKPASLRMSGEHLGIIRKRHEHSGIGGAPIQVEATQRVVFYMPANSRFAGHTPVAIEPAKEQPKLTNGKSNGSSNGHGP